MLRVPVDLGDGPPVVVLHGYAMRPDTYRGLAEILAARGVRVLIPDLFAVRGSWRYPKVLAALEETLDRRHLDQVTFIGHSFGGGIEVGFAAHRPERVLELVFSDTLAVSEEWGLADEALRHPLGLLQLATAQAASAFAVSWALHPRQLAAAAWWGFRSRRHDHIEMIAEMGIPSHVLWANRDSILSQSDGREFAELLGASFTVASTAEGGVVDHDWMFQDPALFVEHLDALDLQVLRGRRPTPRAAAATARRRRLSGSSRRGR